ncbi:MAG: hypothetical protein ABW000_18145 [Actinoplanes sp.]
MNRRFAAVLVPLLSLSLAACAGADGVNKAEVAATPADPKAALAASTAGLKAGDYSFTATIPGGTEAKGMVHIPSHSASLDMTIEEDETKGAIQYRIIEPNRFMKINMDLGEAVGDLREMEEMADASPEMKKMVDGLKAMTEMFSGKYWMRVDMSKLKASDMQVNLEDPDLVGAGGLLGGVVTAQRTGSAITGTLDASALKGKGQMFGEEAFDGLAADKAKALPYEATLDAEGRLSKLVLDVPKVADTPAGKWTVNYTGYGEATEQQKPTGKVKEMPKDGYDMLNSKG